MSEEAIPANNDETVVEEVAKKKSIDGPHKDYGYHVPELIVSMSQFMADKGMMELFKNSKFILKSSTHDAYNVVSNQQMIYLAKKPNLGESITYAHRQNAKPFSINSISEIASGIRPTDRQYMFMEILDDEYLKIKPRMKIGAIEDILTDVILDLVVKFGAHPTAVAYIQSKSRIKIPKEAMESKEKFIDWIEHDSELPIIKRKSPNKPVRTRDVPPTPPIVHKIDCLKISASKYLSYNLSIKRMKCSVEMSESDIVDAINSSLSIKSAWESCISLLNSLASSQINYHLESSKIVPKKINQELEFFSVMGVSCNETHDQMIHAMAGVLREVSSKFLKNDKISQERYDELQSFLDKVEKLPSRSTTIAQYLESHGGLSLNPDEEEEEEQI